jgi:tRNA nucleotidyltransferase (CCA-adding enzyme)
MKLYLVGGAVRDGMLALPFHERDWVVTGATPEDMLAAGFQPVTGDFPVFLHPDTGDECALARRETKVGPGYKGFAVDAGMDVTLEEDLRRRDLTINAMALDQNGDLIDPYHGQEDLDDGVLRHVSSAFSEDPVRLLRIARFAAKLGCWGFRVAHATHALMIKMAKSDDLMNLSMERVWKEMRGALMEDQPWRFFEVLHKCGALQRLLPELAESLGAVGSHAVNAVSQPLDALRRAAADNAALEVRYAVLMLNNQQSGLPTDRACGDLLSLVRELGDIYPQLGSVSANQLLTFVERGAKGGQNRLKSILSVYGYAWPEYAEAASRHVSITQQAAASVTADELMREGLQGAALGKALRERKLQKVQQALG